MGEILSVTCKNKACRYHAELWHGPSMRSFARLKMFEEEILDGKTDHEVVLQKLNDGARLEMGGIYLCPCCNEFRRSRDYYLHENITESPFGTIRYDVSFPFGIPKCEVCGKEMTFIKNVLSSKVKCPKCGGELQSRPIGCFD